MHNHKHDHCEHQMAYCKTCDVAYCKKCAKEWPSQTNPWWSTPQVHPYWQPYTITSGTSTTYAGTTAGHVHD